MPYPGEPAVIYAKLYRLTRTSCKRDMCARSICSAFCLKVLLEKVQVMSGLMTTDPSAAEGADSCKAQVALQTVWESELAQLPYAGDSIRNIIMQNFLVHVSFARCTQLMQQIE